MLPDDIQAYHAAQSPKHAEICEVLAAAITRHIKGAEGKVWHRHPVWFLDGNPIVGYSTLKTPKPCIRLLFWSGQSFDESALAPAPPNTKFKSADVRYTDAGDISAKDLKRWLTKAATIQWDYKNIVKRKGKLVRLK